MTAHTWYSVIVTGIAGISIYVNYRLFLKPPTIAGSTELMLEREKLKKENIEKEKEILQAKADREELFSEIRKLQNGKDSKTVDDLLDRFKF